MRLKTTKRRISFLFLCTAPFVTIVAAGIRALRVAGVYQSIGAALFIAIAAAAWMLGLHAVRTDAKLQQRLALAGGLLVAPFALIALLWVGLSAPPDATAPENQMRYLLLVIMSISVTSGFVVLWHALTDAGERLYSTLGLAANMQAGAAYLIWLSFTLGSWVVRNRTGEMPTASVSLGGVFQILLSVACFLTYLTTAAFAASLARARWLGRGAMLSYVTVSAAAILLLAMGTLYPNHTAASAPWYVRPTFIAGIPAIPWIMPFLMGVVLLRRAGDQRE
jgi:hypothetical protein